MALAHAPVTEDEVAVAWSAADHVRLVRVKAHGVAARNGAVVGGRKQGDIEMVQNDGGCNNGPRFFVGRRRIVWEWSLAIVIRIDHGGGFESFNRGNWKRKREGEEFERESVGKHEQYCMCGVKKKEYQGIFSLIFFPPKF